jgi:hypothetical protein
MEKVIAFPRSEHARARLIHNAVEIASKSRALSHDDVTVDMMASFEKRAIELADRWDDATVADIAAQLLRESSRKPRRARSTNRLTSELNASRIDVALPVAISVNPKGAS